MNKINFKIVVFAIVSIFSFQAFAGNNWNVPTDKKEKNSYIKFDAASARLGEAIYNKNCASCHGNPGKNNSLKSLKPIPPDLSSSGSQLLTDGELFYILTTGRMVMPSFKNVLSEEDRWKVISYIRSFNKSYVQVLSKFDPTKAKLVKIDLKFDSKTNQVTVNAKANEKFGVILLKNTEMSLFAGRYFGRLQIDKTQQTDVNGAAVYLFPKDLPGDKEGNVTLIVKLNDETYGEIEYQKKMKIGVASNKPSLVEERAIWNILMKAPLWIIMLYSAGIVAFGVVLLYLLNNLKKIFKSGTK